jgi:hypothetical protein
VAKGEGRDRCVCQMAYMPYCSIVYHHICTERHLLYAVWLLALEPLVSTPAMAAITRCVVICYACFAECAVFDFAFCGESSFLVLVHSQLPLTWGRGVGRRLGSYDVLPIPCISLDITFQVRHHQSTTILLEPVELETPGAPLSAIRVIQRTAFLNRPCILHQ